MTRAPARENDVERLCDFDLRRIIGGADDESAALASRELSLRGQKYDVPIGRPEACETWPRQQYPPLPKPETIIARLAEVGGCTIAEMAKHFKASQYRMGTKLALMARQGKIIKHPGILDRRQPTYCAHEK